MASSGPERQPWREHLAAFAFACVASLLFTWPLIRGARDHLLRAAYFWDAYTNTMIMGSRVDGLLGRGPLTLYDDYFFAPLPHSIVFNENHFGLSLLFAPFYLASGNPLLAYNLTLLTSLALSVFFTYLLVRRLTGSALAGLLSGVGFAFCPYVVFELGRIQLVATQWIPACFYFLHRALEGRRARDIVLLWLAYLLQIGTCLYYAMFLVPLLGGVGLALGLRERPPRRTLVLLAVCGALAGAVAVALVYPYFAERKHFDLQRSLSFAQSYDGKLAFFAHVPETNLGLPWLRHRSSPRGAHEEVAFPGLTLLLLGTVALGARSWRAWRVAGSHVAWGFIERAVVVLVVATSASVLFRSMLLGLLLAAALVWYWRRQLVPGALTRGLGPYAAVGCLALLLFLGLEPLRFLGRPVHGLYYYLYTYFPGYDGIRKVSRQAVMTTFVAAVVAGFGGSEVLGLMRTRRSRVVAAALLFAAMTLELRSFPHPLESQWAGASVPPVYRFLAGLPSRDLVAVTPESEGARRFRGDGGMALHNYLALYHKHRFLDGQSSFTPPVTDLVARALLELPSKGAYDVLRAVGADHLLVHGADLPPSRRDLPEQLLAQSAWYERVFFDGADSVFSLRKLPTGAPALAPVPALPAGAERLDEWELTASAAFEPERLKNAVDGNPKTLWSSRVPQAKGQSFEVALSSPRLVRALEIENPGHELFLPMSYVLEASREHGPFRVVARQPELVLYRAQVFEPKAFVYRIVLPEPVEADRLRLSVDRPLPGIDLVVHEVRVYVTP